jgi:DNA polymerase III subunit gamma/tau
MAYQVIARKWRPQTFEEVTGQEHITRTLRNAIEHERLHHAYLFSGARGVGKTTTARLLAKALNCHRSDRPTISPCSINDPDACASCREIAEGRSIDVLEIDAASNTGVDNVRDQIIGNVAVRPARDRYKVFIIDEVHMLSGAAFNALLKTLEEPPPRVLFIMATTELHKLPDTILSRCQQFEFRTIATSRIAERLRLIAEAEKIKISDDALREIARAGEGSMRDAQSAFDQVISFSSGEIKSEDVELALGIASSEMLARTVRAIAEQKASEILGVVNDLVARGQDLRNFCRDLMGYFRNLLIVKLTGKDDEILEVSTSERQELANIAESFSESDLVRFFHSLTDTESNLKSSAHPRYQLEIGLVKLIEMRRLASVDQLIERIAALESSIRNGKAPAAGTPPVSGSATGNRSSSSPMPITGKVHQASSSETSSVPVALSPEVTKPVIEVNPTPSSAEVSQAIGASASSISARVANPPGLRLVAPLPSAAPPSDHVGRAVPASPTAVDDVNLSAQLKSAIEKRNRPLLLIALEGAYQINLIDNELHIEFSQESKHLRNTLVTPESMKLIRESCREILGRDVGIRVSVTDVDDNSPEMSAYREAIREKQQLREIAENHPAVQQLLKTFHAEIIEVRRVDTDAK